MQKRFFALLMLLISSSFLYAQHEHSVYKMGLQLQAQSSLQGQSATKLSYFIENCAPLSVRSGISLRLWQTDLSMNLNHMIPATPYYEAIVEAYGTETFHQLFQAEIPLHVIYTLGERWKISAGIQATLMVGTRGTFTKLSGGDVLATKGTGARMFREPQLSSSAAIEYKLWPGVWLALQYQGMLSALQLREIGQATLEYEFQEPPIRQDWLGLGLTWYWGKH